METVDDVIHNLAWSRCERVPEIASPDGNVIDDQPGFFCMTNAFLRFSFISPCIFDIWPHPPWYPGESLHIQDRRRQMAVPYISV